MITRHSLLNEHTFRNRRPVRSAIARTVTVALSLVAGSLTVWASVNFVAPEMVSAAPEPLAEKSCRSIFGSWWYLRFSGESEGTIEIGDDQVTIERQVPSSELSEFELRVQFYSDETTCSDFTEFSNPRVEETIDRPAGLYVCVASQSTSGSMGTFVARPWWWDSSDSSFETSENPKVDVAQGTSHSFDSFWSGAPTSDVEGRFEVMDIAGVLSDPYPEDPDIYVDVKIVFGTNPVCTFSTPNNDQPADGFDLDLDIDIDIEHYRNRAAAEAGALPNTL